MALSVEWDPEHVQTPRLFDTQPRQLTGTYEIANMDAFTWLAEAKPCSIHAVVTDPPYGLVEYTPKELEKLQAGKGGVWRLPPSFDGSQRRPVPRFTVLSDEDRERLRAFFRRLADLLLPALVPGAHVFVATNPLVSHLVYTPFIDAGFEKRGEIVRLVYTLRGGDRPKNAHKEFSEISVMPKSCWEPWGLFRKPCEGRVQDNLRKWRTGACGAFPRRSHLRISSAPHPRVAPSALSPPTRISSLSIFSGNLFERPCRLAKVSYSTRSWGRDQLLRLL